LPDFAGAQVVQLTADHGQLTLAWLPTAYYLL